MSHTSDAKLTSHGKFAANSPECVLQVTSVLFTDDTVTSVSRLPERIRNTRNYYGLCKEYGCNLQDIRVNWPRIYHDLLIGCPRGVMVKAMNCGIVVREFVLQSRYYVHFRANTLGKGMNPLILPPAMGK